MVAGAAAVRASSKALSASGPFDPLNMPGMRFFTHTDDVVAGGTGNGYAVSLPNRKGAQSFTRGGTDATKLSISVGEKPGHDVLYRAGTAQSQNLQYSGADLGGLFNGSISFTLGSYCMGFIDTAPGTNGIVAVGASTNSLSVLSPTNTATSGMRLSIAGTGTGGGAVSGASSGDVAYTRDIAWHVVAASYDSTTRQVTHLRDGVVMGVTAALTLREPLAMAFVVLGATSNTGAANEMAFGGWFGATSAYTATDTANLKAWYDASFA